MNCKNCGYSADHSTDGYCINCGTKVRGGFLSKLFSSREKSENHNREKTTSKISFSNDPIENWESPQTTDTQEETLANAAPKPQKEEANVLVEILRHLFLPWWVIIWEEKEKEKEEDEDLLVYTMPHLENMEYVRSRGGTW